MLKTENDDSIEEYKDYDSVQVLVQLGRLTQEDLNLMILSKNFITRRPWLLKRTKCFSIRSKFVNSD